MQQVSISLIANGRRRPSATLLRTIANILDIKPIHCFSHRVPEAKLLVRTGLGSRTSVNNEIWRAFTQDKDLLACYKVPLKELHILSQVRIIGEVRHPRDFTYILSMIRQALKS